MFSKGVSTREQVIALTSNLITLCLRKGFKMPVRVEAEVRHLLRERESLSGDLVAFSVKKS